MKRKKSALRKDFRMEIQKSIGRFLSIFLIVALGASLFAGIRAAQPDMVLSGDAYTDENKLMDIKVVSTYGLTEDDKHVIENLPAIESVEGSYSVDVLCESNNNMKVLHVMSYMESMNKITVKEGRLPRNEKECLVDQDFLKASEYEIGDMVTLESGTDTELTDVLKQTEFKIVGSGNSPLYFSFDRGSSTIGTGTVNGFMILSPEAFNLEVYTEIYAAVKGAEEVLSFTDEYNKLIDEAMNQIQMVENARCEIRRDDLAELAQLEIDKARNEMNQKKEEAESAIQENEELLDAAELQIELGKIQLESGKLGVESGESQIESGRTLVKSGQSIVGKAKGEIENTKKELDKVKETLPEGETDYEKIIDYLKAEKQKLDTNIEQWNIRLEEMEEEQAAILKEMIEWMEGMSDTIDSKIKQMESSNVTEIQKKGLVNIESYLKKSEQELTQLEQELIKKENELFTAEQDLNAAKEKITSSEAEIAAGEQEVESGKTQLEEAKQEMESQLQKGEEELKKAEEQISDIDIPIWYIFDRSSIPEYTGYGENAERIAALSIIFPNILFLVAALISLTTMTRMVEEQRIHIGTLKALGYGKVAIMIKFLGYALLATIGGSVFGVLLGEKLYPYVIITAYRVMYIHIPHTIIPYHWEYGAVATIIAVCCTSVATILACYKALAQQPAALMRPEAPQIGKRTLIEKIPFLWRSLNFTWKSSLRNLFRYKKRFFMALIGIGGCMSLLVVGYGLRDSVTFVAAYQYENLQKYEMGAFLSEDIESETREELKKYLSNNKDVSAYLEIGMSTITVENDENKVEAYLTVIEDVEKVEEFFTYQDRVTKKKCELSDKAAILTEKTADTLGVKEGDSIYLLVEGQGGHKVEIADICENYAGHYVYLTAPLYEEIYGEPAFQNSILIKSDADMKKMEEIGESILEYAGVLNVQYTANISRQIESALVALDQVMRVLIMVAGMLSFVVMYNLNNININERRRELATLKVLGFYDMEVASYVYRENILLTLFGVILGCGLGKIFHAFTLTTVEVDLVMFGREIFPMSYLIAALITIGFAAFVNFIMYFKLKKIDMVESLKSVE